MSSADCGTGEQTTLTFVEKNSKEVLLNFSIDSGMDDPALPHSQSMSDDSEDEVVCKRRVNRKTILDDDDSDDDIDENNDEVTEKDPSASDENKENVQEGNDEGENDVDSNDPELDLEHGNNETPDVKEDEIGEDDQVESATLRMDFKDSDIFDAESDDEQRPALTDDECAENNSAHENDGDEGFDESQINPALLAKLKKMKGASKTPKQKERLNRKAKPTVEQMTEVYSESQRMLRDSRVNLPYYEPETKSLDDFLARASKKRQEYSALSKPKDFQKALIIHEKLSVTPPKQSSYKEKGPKLSLKSKEATRETPTISDSAPVVQSHDSGLESQELGLSQASTVILTENVLNAGSSNVTQHNKSIDDEDLPDINPISLTTDTSTCLDDRLKQNVQDDTQTVSEISLVTKNSLETQMSCEGGDVCNNAFEVVSLQKDPSRDLFNSLTTEEQMEEESIQQIFKDVEGHDLCIEKENNEGDCVKSLDRTSPSPLACENVQTHENHGIGEGQNNDEAELLNSKEDENIISEVVCSSNSKEDIEILEGEDCSLNDEGNKESSATIGGTPNCKSNKLRLLEKLAQQGLTVPDLPKLSGSPDSVINLDNEAPAESPRDSGVLKLMDRLIQHQTKKKVHTSYDVNLSIIEKEGIEGEQKELKLKSLTYHVEEEKEEQPSATPGGKLALLKEKLGAGMKMKREEARSRRQQMFNLENEEGFEGGSKSDEEQEEAEMTDDYSSSDEEEEEEEEEEDGLMGMMDGSDDGEDYNPLLDNEARDDDDEEEEEEDIFGMDENSNDVKLRFEVSDEEEEEDGSDKEERDDDATPKLNEDDESSPVKRKKKAHHRILSDDEEDSKPEKKTSGLERYHSDESLPDIELTPLTKHFQDTQYLRDSSRSPELYGPTQFEESSNSTRPGDHLNDSGSNFNPHSQMLDADGYLKMTPTQRPPKSRISLLMDAHEPEDNAIMDGFDSSSKMTAGEIFGGISGPIGSQAGNMSELLGLCSGTFQQNSLSEDAINPSQNRRYEEEENELSNPFQIVNNEDDDSVKAGQRKRIKPVLSDSEDEREADTDIEDDDDISGPGKFSGFKDKISKGIRKEFLEDEAELSGSEYDSDENVDLAEEDDILEEEAGDRDMAGVSEEELRNQVGKVHMKQLLDDDDRAVMRFKEMYLQDGDLHSDGNGRMRHFRWKDAGDYSQQDVFQQQSDEEQVEEDVEEIKWRKERIEREKFLEESQKGEEEPNEELQKFGQLFVKRCDSTSSLPRTPIIEPKQSTTKQPSMKKKGSFLSRGKAALVQFASIAKTALGGNSKQNARSFVFQSKENQEGENGEKEETTPQPMQPPKRKAHSIPSGGSSQVAKKPRLPSNSKQAPPSVKRGGSIFNLLDQ